MISYNEGEYVVLPTTFQNIRLIKNKKEKKNLSNKLRLVNSNIKIYATNMYQSTDLSFITRDIYNSIDSPLTWFSCEDPKSKTKIEKILNTISAVFVTAFGGFLTWECPMCHVVSRFMDYNGWFMDLSV